MGQQDRVILEKTIDRVTVYLVDAYQQCFKQSITEESLSEFDQLSKSFISNWSQWNEKPVSKPNASSVEPAFSKSHLNLLRLADEIRQNVQNEPKQKSFKDPS